MSYMLSNQEKAVLKTIVKNTRTDFFRKNKYLFNESALDKILEDKEIHSENTNEIAKNTIINLQVSNIEDIITEPKLSKLVKALTYNEKLVLFMYYVENKTEQEISNSLSLTRIGATQKRLRALNKLRTKYKREGK